jgi:hypothetical protein
MTITTPSSSQAGLVLPILAELTPCQDGTYILRPRVSDANIDSWIAPKRAAKLIGIRGRSIYRLVDPACPFLVCKRPLRGRCLISLRSIQNFVAATSVPDFWDDRLQQQTLQAAVRQELESLQGLRPGAPAGADQGATLSKKSFVCKRSGPARKPSTNSRQ